MIDPDQHSDPTAQPSVGDANPLGEQGEPSGPDDSPRVDAEAPRAWPSAAGIGTVLLLVIMVVAGLVAAFLVTPRPDEGALARPDDSDVVIADGAPSSWDPAAISDTESAQMLAQVFEGLTVLDADAAVRPALAESWSVGDDGRDIVFTLRDGLTFSDGSPLVAEDVRRSWLRVLDPARPSPLSSLLDDVAGAAAYARGEVDADAVGIRAEGRTLRVEFARPATYFPAVAAVPTLAVVPGSIDALAHGPVEDEAFPASGAFVPVAQTASEVRLVANDAYWAGPPLTRSITVVTDIGGRSEVDAFEDEAVDWTRISPADATWIRYDERLGPQLRHAEEMGVEILGFDTGRPPFDDAAVRRAVAMAVDWSRLEQADGSSTDEVTSIVPPGIAARGEGDYRLGHDPVAARAELAAAGYPGGEGFPAVSLATYGIGPATAIAHELKRELGIDVDVEEWSFDDHSALLDSDPPSLWTLAWNADYPDAHDFLGLLLRSDSTANAGRWADPAYDALIDAAAATVDAAEQERLYGEAQAILREQAPIIPLGYGSSWALSRDGLLGAQLSGVGLLRYADLARGR
jgi:oligopeptide transport system substrate-binding protein